MKKFVKIAGILELKKSFQEARRNGHLLRKYYTRIEQRSTLNKLYVNIIISTGGSSV